MLTRIRFVLGDLLFALVQRIYPNPPELTTHYHIAELGVCAYCGDFHNLSTLIKRPTGELMCVECMEIK